MPGVENSRPVAVLENGTEVDIMSHENDQIKRIVEVLGMKGKNGLHGSGEYRGDIDFILDFEDLTATYSFATWSGCTEVSCAF